MEEDHQCFIAGDRKKATRSVPVQTSAASTDVFGPVSPSPTTSLKPNAPQEYRMARGR